MNMLSNDEVELRTALSLLDRLKSEHMSSIPYKTYSMSNEKAPMLEECWINIKKILDERRDSMERRLTNLMKSKSPTAVRAITHLTI
jgi:hypothetical protein